MLLNGTTTTITKGNVSIDLDDFVAHIRTAMNYTNPSFAQVDHIVSGKVMRFDGYNYHNGNEEYVAMRDATVEDVALMAMYTNLVEWLTAYENRGERN